MCKCGCNSCETKSTALVLNESIAPKAILSEGLKHHIDTNKPLTEHLYRAGSSAYFNLIAEARSLYSRGILEFTNEDDLAILTETDLGHFGMFEGKKVPLDFPIELNEQMDIYDDIANSEFGMDYDQLGSNEKEWVRDEMDNMEIEESVVTEARFKVAGRPVEVNQGKKADGTDWTVTFKNGKTFPLSDVLALIKPFPKGIKKSDLSEAKKKKGKNENKPIGKPMRDTSGGKAYKVYVRDPKTKKVKTVRFGSGGLRAKINDSKARAAFAARHKCSTKKDKTKAGYWSCRLPRYAKLLGLKSSFSGFW